MFEICLKLENILRKFEKNIKKITRKFNDFYQSVWKFLTF